MKHLKCKSVEVKTVRSQKALQHRRMYNKIKCFHHWAIKKNLKIIRSNELQEIWKLYVYRKVKRFRRPDYKLFLRFIASRTSDSRIIVPPELSDVFKVEVKRSLHLLGQIKNDFKKQARLHFIDCIPFNEQDEHSVPIKCQTLTLAKEIGWKQERVQYYHDPESRMEFERKYMLQYLELHDEKIEPTSTLEDKIRKYNMRTINELKDMYKLELIDILKNLPKEDQKDVSFSRVADTKDFRKFLKERSKISIFGLVVGMIEGQYILLQKESLLKLLEAHEQLLKIQHVFKEYLEKKKIRSKAYSSLFELADKIEKHYSFLQQQLHIQGMHKSTFNDFFRGIIRDGEIVRRVSSRQQQARNIIKDVLKNEIATSRASEFMFLSQDRKKIKKIKCELDTNSKIATLLRKLLKIPLNHELKTSSKVIILFQNVNRVKKIIDNAIEFGKVQKEIKSDNLVKPSKSGVKSSKEFNWRHLLISLLKLMPLLIVVLIPLLMFFNVSLGNLYFPRDFKFNYPLLQVLFFTFGLFIYTRGMDLSMRHKLFLASSFLSLFFATLFAREIAGASISSCVTPLMLIPSYFLFRNLPKVERVRHAKQGKFKEALYSLDIKYHEKKFSILGGSLLIFAIISWCCFIYAPHWFFIPVFLMITIITLFTHESSTATKRSIELSRKLGLRSHSLAPRARKQYRSESVYRAGILVLIFLVCMPLIFAVNSLVGIMRNVCGAFYHML